MLALFPLVFLGVVLILAVSFLYKYKAARLPQQENVSPLPKGKPGNAGVCPVCCTVLQKGEKLTAKVYPPKKIYPVKEEARLCSIHGCPHCYPTFTAHIKRVCPVCKSTVPPTSYLVARLFERSNTQRHVHILGCQTCLHV